MKKTKNEGGNMFGIIKKHNKVLFLAAVLIIGLAVKGSMINFVSGDYYHFLSKWYDFIKGNGGFFALKTDFADYAPAYLYFLTLSTLVPIPKIIAIKLISIMFDFAAAWFALLIVKEKYKEGFAPYLAFGLVFLAPTLVLNSSKWGQCDVIYTSFILASIYFVLKQRNIAALLLFGIAFSLKLQTVFVAPLFLVLLLRKKVNFFQLLLVPMVYILSVIPAALVGRPFLELLMIYVKQGDRYRKLQMNAPNIYQWIVKEPYELLKISGIVFAFLLVLYILFAAYKKMEGMDKEEILKLALTFSLVVPFVLPGMHERYFFIADLISIIYAFYFPKRAFIAVLVNFASLFSYIPYLYYKTPIKFSFLAVVLLLAVIFAIVDLFSGRKDEPPEIEKNYIEVADAAE
ncbi:MAG: hypothetical protein N2645_21285 [Clostridia bacterium]|nr:hypothetical protein [Clostridia bacterium]